MSNEIELKFEIDNRHIENLQLFLNQWLSCDEAEFSTLSDIDKIANKLTLFNTYYDTKDCYLRNQYCGLRIRETESVKGQHYEITLKRDAKTVAGLHERLEFNADLPNLQLDLSILPDDALPKNCNIQQLQQDLLPLFCTNFKRQTWLISFANSEIEVAFDQGNIQSNGKMTIIQEIELEIKQGDKQDLFNFAIELSRFNLHLFSQSKAARGYRLMQGIEPQRSQFDKMNQKLPALLQFWQQNEEYALEHNDLILYQQTLNQVNSVLIKKKISSEPEFTLWQHSLSSIDSVKNFAYSEINTTLKLMLLKIIDKFSSY